MYVRNPMQSSMETQSMPLMIVFTHTDYCFIVMMLFIHELLKCRKKKKRMKMKKKKNIECVSKKGGMRVELKIANVFMCACKSGAIELYSLSTIEN